MTYGSCWPPPDDEYLYLAFMTLSQLFRLACCSGGVLWTTNAISSALTKMRLRKAQKYAECRRSASASGDGCTQSIRERLVTAKRRFVIQFEPIRPKILAAPRCLSRDALRGTGLYAFPFVSPRMILKIHSSHTLWQESNSFRSPTKWSIREGSFAPSTGSQPPTLQHDCLRHAELIWHHGTFQTRYILRQLADCHAMTNHPRAG